MLRQWNEWNEDGSAASAGEEAHGLVHLGESQDLEFGAHKMAFENVEKRQNLIGKAVQDRELLVEEATDSAAFDEQLVAAVVLPCDGTM